MKKGVLLTLSIISVIVFFGAVTLYWSFFGNKEDDGKGNNETVSISAITNALVDARLMMSSNPGTGGAKESPENVIKKDETLYTSNRSFNFNIIQYFSDVLEQDMTDGSWDSIFFAGNNYLGLAEAAIKSISNYDVVYNEEKTEGEPQSVWSKLESISKTKSRLYMFWQRGIEPSAMSLNVDAVISIGEGSFDYKIDFTFLIDFGSNSNQTQIVYLQIGKQKDSNDKLSFVNYASAALSVSFESILTTNLTVGDISSVWEGGVFNFDTNKCKNGSQQNVIDALNGLRTNLFDYSSLAETENPTQSEIFKAIEDANVQLG